MLAAVGLALTVLVARADLSDASESLVRGEGEALVARLHEGLRPFGRGRALIGRVCGRQGRRQPGECEEWRQDDGARNQRRQFRL